MKDLNYYKNNCEEDYIKTPISVLRYITELEKNNETKQLTLSGVIKRIEEYAPEPIELPKFDLTKKSDHIYCIEWGMKKAERNEFEG